MKQKAFNLVMTLLFVICLCYYAVYALYFQELAAKTFDVTHMVILQFFALPILFFALGFLAFRFLTRNMEPTKFSSVDRILMILGPILLGIHLILAVLTLVGSFDYHYFMYVRPWLFLFPGMCFALTK